MRRPKPSKLEARSVSVRRAEMLSAAWLTICWLSASRLVGFGRGGVGVSFVWVIGSPYTEFSCYFLLRLPFFLLF